MAIKQLNPYLYFDGTAAKAIALYERALGAKTESRMRLGDAPGGPTSGEAAERVMHAVLRLGGGTIMLSDSMPRTPLVVGGNSQVCLDFDDAAEMQRAFDALSEGGSVTMPLQDTFWGARFGTLTDAFGIRWMFNCEKKAG